MKIVLYANSQCKKCESARQFLSLRGIGYILKKIDENYNHRAELLQIYPGARSTPIFIVDDTKIFTSLSKLKEFLKIDR